MDYVESVIRGGANAGRNITELKDRTSEFFSVRKASGSQRRNPRLAITVADNGSYPVQGVGGGNTFPMILLDGGFADSAGRNTALIDLRSNVVQTRVYCLSQNWIPPGTVIQVWNDRGTDSSKPGEWWTPWTDNLRLGKAETTIHAGGNGYVMEYAPNNYSPELAVRRWYVRNRTCNGIPATAWVYFEQDGSVAYTWSNCGGSTSESTSGSTSTSGSVGSTSGSLGSQSGPSGSSFSGSIACCEEFLGPWPDGSWPPSLTVTITGACCAALNRSFTLPKRITEGRPDYFFDWTLGPDCNGDTFSHCGINVLCNPANGGQWLFSMDLQNSFNYISCDPLISDGAVELTLLNCSPLQFATASNIPLCSKPGTPSQRWCNGSMNADITL